MRKKNLKRNYEETLDNKPMTDSLSVRNFVLVSLVTTNLLVISHVVNFYWLYIYANVIRVGVNRHLKQKCSLI